VPGGDKWKTILMGGRRSAQTTGRGSSSIWTLDEGGSLRCGYHALGMSRPTFRKHASAWCELHGQTMPRRGRPYYGRRRSTYMACLPGTVTRQEFENRRVPDNDRLGFNFPPPPRLSKLPERAKRPEVDWSRVFKNAASSEPSSQTATDVAPI